jgi:hypothetical protein
MNMNPKSNATLKKDKQVEKNNSGKNNAKSEQKNDDLEKNNVKKKFLSQRIKDKFLSFNDIKNSNYYIYAIFIIIAYLFYQLGYSFIYSYYFGGKNFSIRTMDVAINQIPFNMALVSVIGIIVFMLLILYYIPLHMCLTEEKFLKKFIWIIPNIVTIYIIFSIVLLLNGAQENKQITDILVLLGVVTSSILVALLIFKTFMSMAVVSVIDGIVNLLSLIIEMGILVWFGYNITLKMDKLIMVNDKIIYIFIIPIVFIFVIVQDCIMTLRRHQKKLFRNIASYVVYLPIFGMFFINKIELKNFFIIFIGPLVLLGLSWLVNRVWYKYKSSMAKKKQQRGISEKKDRKQGDAICKGLQFIISSFMLLFMIMLYLFLYSLIGMIGNSFGKQIVLNSPSNITYYTINGNNSIKGIVVEQTGNTYFISTYPERELVIINSPYIIVEPNMEER